MEGMIAELVPQYQTLLSNVEGINQPRKSTANSYEEYRVASIAATNHHEINFDAKRMALFGESIVKLAIHAYDALMHEFEYFEALIEVLSTATRATLLWRSQFGGFNPESHETHTVSMRATEPDCVLEVARRVCTLNYHVSSSAITYALKVIANCCADDNSNRRLIIHREGIYTLVRLVLHDADLCVLIPTLYNVCVDYDEPSVFLRPTTDRADSMTSQEDPEMITLSAEHLASACGSTTEFATFQLLLSLTEKLAGSDTLADVGHFLASLIEMSTQAALHGIEHIRSDPTSKESPFKWQFVVNGEDYNTISLARDFGHACDDILPDLHRAMLNVLSQRVARNKLLDMNDDSIWRLFTLPTWIDGRTTINGVEDGEDPYDALFKELSHLQQVYLKALYEITGDPQFRRLGRKASSMLISRSAEEIRDFVTQRIGLQDDIDAKKSLYSKSNIEKQAEAVSLAMACVILGHLCASEEYRNQLLSEPETLSHIAKLVESKRSADVLYPAVNLVSRLMSDPRFLQPLVFAGILQKMQHLLTAKGLGLAVPREAVVAYKVFAWRQPKSLNALFTHQGNDTVIVEDILRLWSLTGQADTKLEIGLFFLEVLRGNIPVKENDTMAIADHEELQSLNKFLVIESAILTEIFTWMCLHAEPKSQREHGWFLLAVLSLWSGAKKSIIDAIDGQQELRGAVIRVSQMPSGSSPGNLKLLLANLLADTAQYEGSNEGKETLRKAAANLDLVEDSNSTRPIEGLNIADG